MERRLKILYRKNLKMSPGKIAAQAVHASAAIGHDKPLMSVVVLGVSDRKFSEHLVRSDIRPHVVLDAGYTEVPPGTETCMAFYEEA